MLKVLIVDDDLIARTTLKVLIDWERNGFEISGEATNGLNAVQMISDNAPDIVITDMSMPVMDGVELIEYIVENCPKIKVIALSGYNDFNYVRNSLKNGAVDYILKHKLETEELLNVLHMSKELIIKERQTMDRKEQLQEHLIIGENVAKRNFIEGLLLDGISSREEAGKELIAHEISMDLNNLVIVLAEIDDFAFLREKFNMHELATLLQSFSSISEQALAVCARNFVSHLENGRFVIIFSIGNIHSDQYIYSEINNSINKVKQSVKRYLNITASYSVSNICKDILNIRKYYRDAEKALKDKFFKGKNNILRENWDHEMEKKVMNLDIADEKMIIKSVKSLETQNVCGCIGKIFDEFTAYKANIRSVQMVCGELISIVNRIARDSGIDIRNVYSNDDAPYNKLQKYETIADIKQWVLDVYTMLISLLMPRTVKINCSENTEKVIEFINRNYKNDISLNDAADYIGVNSSYLSHIFKEECGKGVIEYLNTVRIEKSKMFIESGDYKLKDIVKEVGFNSYNYFFKVFKDITGTTPLEYEKMKMS